MPELPEVETIKNELLPSVVGQRFISVTIYDVRLVRQPSSEELCLELPGKVVKSLERRGKYLMFHLSSGEALIFHLRMTGALLLNSGQIDRYTRAAFRFDNGSQLIFVDRRRLGVLWLVEDAQDVVGKLGTEPLSAEFTAKSLAYQLRKRQAPIKAILLDQALIAGIGNMYADEALFVARIHPSRRANSLSSHETKTLYDAIVKVLRAAISNKGASIDTYRRPDGELGTAQSNFYVAHRGGEPCPVCGASIQRLAIRNRGSYFCPNCQKL